MDNDTQLRAGDALNATARANRRLAWLIVGSSALLSLALAGVLVVWGYGQLRQWAAEQPRQRGTPQGELVTTPIPPADLEDLDELAKGSGEDADPAADGTGRAPLSVAPGSARPVGSVATWVTTSDYPPAALRAGLEGRTQVTLTVNGTGRPTACVVARSSGHAALDRATCGAMMLRGRFNPPGGTRRWTSPIIRWKLPD